MLKAIRDSDRPYPVVFAIVLIALPVLYDVLNGFRAIIPIVVLFLPCIFILIRVWTGDNLARWFASILLILVTLTGIYGYLNYQFAQYDASLSSATIDSLPNDGIAIAGAIKAQQEMFQWHHFVLFACYPVALVLLHLPQSRSWFTSGTITAHGFSNNDAPTDG